jgi:hypothetical protein
VNIREIGRTIAKAVALVLVGFVLVYGIHAIANIIAGPTVGETVDGTHSSVEHGFGISVEPDSALFSIDPADMIKPAEMLATDDDKTRDLKMTFNFFIVGDRFYDCPDGRNKDRTYLDMNKLVPCVNGSALVRLESGKLTVDAKGSTNPESVTIVEDKTLDELNEFYSGNDIHFYPSGWTFTLDTNAEEMTEDAAKPDYFVSYSGVPEHDEFGAYVSRNGGPWEITDALYLGAMPWLPTDKVEIVVFWHDPSVGMIDAPVPFKNWTKVQKNADVPTS